MEKQTLFLVLSVVFHMQFNLSFREKINLWRQSVGQQWKRRRSAAMGKFLQENATNLGKMNHSHFIWTSVLPPQTPHHHPLLQTFIHLWQFYYNLCRWLEAREPQRMLRGDGPTCRGAVEFITRRTAAAAATAAAGRAHLERPGDEPAPCFRPAAECLPPRRRSRSKAVWL